MKTTEQLLAEIAALKTQLAARDSNSDQSVSGGSSQPIFSVPITRRQVIQQSLVGWVSPVILSVPLATALLTKSGTAQAQAVPGTTAPTSAPIPSTSAPSALPTPAAPTVFVNAVPIPGLGLIGIAALGSALAATGSKLVMDRIDAAGANGSKSSGGSGDDSGSK
jgi:hypothetical protein